MEKFKLKFNIVSWSAWGVGDIRLAENANNVYYGVPELEGVKPMVKRRMPLLSKYIYELSNKKMTEVDYKGMPVIFTSKNSELNRTFKIIRSFDGDVSPTQFSMSVHNAIPGLLSVVCQDSSVYTVIDCMSGTLEVALIEAMSLLEVNNYVKIICFDEELPEELSQSFPNHSNPIVMSLVIEKGDEITISSEQGGSYNKENFLKLVEFLNQKRNNYTNSTKRLMWKWHNNAKI